MKPGTASGIRIGSAATLALLALLAPGPARAQSKTGTTIGAFLMIEPSAHIAGMGNAGASLDLGLEAVYFNPAAIGRTTNVGVQFDHSAWIADITYDYVAGAVPLGKWGNAYAAVTALNSGAIDVRTVNQPLGTGEQFHVSDIAIGLGYGKEITDRFSAGFQLTYVQETIWHSTLNTATLSIGTLFRVSENGLHLGASLTNFGTQGGFSGSDLRIAFDANPDNHGDNSQVPAELFTDSFSLPVQFRVGLGLPVKLTPNAMLNLAVDAFHPNDNTEGMSAGAELAYRDLFAVRAGWQDAFQQDSEGGLTAGGGFKGTLSDYAYRLDYAWADQGRLGSTHRFSVGMNF